MASCPYHARVFNWDQPVWPEGMEKQLTPHTSVRSRGVVEKCSFCHHRLMYAKDAARVAGEDPEKLADGAYMPACGEVCPTGAITFGDVKNPEHARLRAGPQPVHLPAVERRGTDPQVYYMSKRAGSACRATTTWPMKKPKRAREGLTMDRALWPEGVERCSLGKFLLCLGACGVVFALGAYEAIMILFPDGLARTALDNYFGFGLWITFDLAVIALARAPSSHRPAQVHPGHQGAGKDRQPDGHHRLFVLLPAPCSSWPWTWASRCAPGSASGTPTSAPC
jgi:ferredoxin